MPIYRGAQKFTPRPGGRALSRVYRGDQLVWQAGPSYPITWEWSGPSGDELSSFREWEVPTSGQYQITGTVHSGSTQFLIIYLFLNDPTGNSADSFLAGNMRYDPGSVSTTWTGTLQQGDTIYWSGSNIPAGPVTATGSIDRA